VIVAAATFRAAIDPDSDDATRITVSSSGPLGPRNAQVQRLRRLTRRRGARHDEGVVVVEGPMLVLEALLEGAEVAEVYVDAAALDRAIDQADAAGELLRLVGATRAAGLEVHTLGPGALEAASSTATPQPALAVVRWRPRSLDTLEWALADPVLVLDALSDPGNVGTLLRIAEAAGFGAVIVTPGTVDVTNPKVVRAAAGALFRTPVIEDATPSQIAELAYGAGVRLVGTVARGGVAHDAFDWRPPVALVLGSEAHGLSAALDARLDGRVTIPMAGRVESLNAAIAGAVVAFEIARARRATS
jgi:TrmH family RNA methyltransferase